MDASLDGGVHGGSVRPGHPSSAVEQSTVEVYADKLNHLMVARFLTGNSRTDSVLHPALR
jgi:hypothetical protein